MSSNDGCRFSERDLTTHIHVRLCYRPSVCLSVVCLSVDSLSPVTLVRPTQAAQVFGNISTTLDTLAIRENN